ncbi:hypothetical protein CASFOL_034869 [Castilleja foliolosa]|uniref:Uncharacterized protein n=1 Tax=Castilleja foliolosa TaxID=1961234 RepID=A0ABD3BRS0_9LAMI
MAEGVGGGGPEPKPTSSYESSGDRLRFTVELRPGETPIVSWKKLLKEATSSKPKRPGPSVSFPAPETDQQLVFQPQLLLPAVGGLVMVGGDEGWVGWLLKGGWGDKLFIYFLFIYFPHHPAGHVASKWQ